MCIPKRIQWNSMGLPQGFCPGLTDDFQVTAIRIDGAFGLFPFRFIFNYRHPIRFESGEFELRYLEKHTIHSVLKHFHSFLKHSICPYIAHLVYWFGRVFELLDVSRRMLCSKGLRGIRKA